LGSQCLRAVEKRLPILRRDCLQQFSVAAVRDPKQRQAIEAAAQAVLDARAKYPDSSLAALYDPLAMPADLVRAHHKLDAAVDAAYSKKEFFRRQRPRGLPVRALPADFKPAGIEKDHAQEGAAIAWSRPATEQQLDASTLANAPYRPIATGCRRCLRRVANARKF
jgi:hypothetical protein